MATRIPERLFQGTLDALILQALVGGTASRLRHRLLARGHQRRRPQHRGRGALHRPPQDGRARLDRRRMGPVAQKETRKVLSSHRRPDAGSSVSRVSEWTAYVDAVDRILRPARVASPRMTEPLWRRLLRLHGPDPRADVERRVRVSPRRARPRPHGEGHVRSRGPRSRRSVSSVTSIAPPRSACRDRRPAGAPRPMARETGVQSGRTSPTRRGHAPIARLHAWPRSPPSRSASARIPPCSAS